MSSPKPSLVAPRIYMEHVMNPIKPNSAANFETGGPSPVAQSTDQATQALQDAMDLAVAEHRKIFPQFGLPPEDSESDEDTPEDDIDFMAKSIARNDFVLRTSDQAWSCGPDDTWSKASPTFWSALMDINRLRGQDVPERATLTAGLKFHPGIFRPFDAMGVGDLTIDGNIRAATCQSPVDGVTRKLLDLTQYENLERLSIDGDPDMPLMIVVQGGVQVSALNMKTPALLKSIVVSIGEGGAATTRPLYGQIHERRAHEFLPEGAELNRAIQISALDHNLNGAAPPMIRQRPDGRVDAVPMDCRVLAAIALNLTLSKAARRAQGSAPASMLYEPLLSTQGVTAQASRGVIDDLRRMYAQGACAIFEPGEFGAVAAAEFASLEPGGTRCFVVGAPQPHFLGLTLRHKQLPAARSEFAQSLYDPNISAHHERAAFGDLPSLQNQDLEHWLGTGARGTADTFRAYFPHWDALACLYRWPPTNEPSHVRLFVTEKTKDSSVLLYALMENGHAQEVSRWIASQIVQATDGTLARAELEMRLSGKGPVALSCALQAAAAGELKDQPYLCAKPDAIRAYIRGVLAVPPALLDEDAKFRLLLGSTLTESAMSLAMMGSGIDAAMAIAEEVFAAPEGMLSHSQIARLVTPELNSPGVNLNLAPLLRQRLEGEQNPAMRTWLEATIAAFPAVQ